MKKKIFFTVLVCLVVPVLVVGQTAGALTLPDPRGVTRDVAGKVLAPGVKFNRLMRGAKGPEVKDLQEILKSDPSVYPEGLVTGYYGPLTQKAVRKLQQRFGLSQTGVVDEATANVIFPHPDKVKVTIVVPNGGEVWDRGEGHEIKWRLSKPGPVEGEEIDSSEQGETLESEEIIRRFFWPRGRLDLIRSDGTFVKHIATVNLAHQSYEWRITRDIPNGDDYKIRIGIGRGVVCKDKPCPLSPLKWPAFFFGDTSDGPFTITGETPPPSGDIQEAIELLREVMEGLNKLLALLESML